MLEAIRHAKFSITFETFIYWKGEIGKKFADALSERARAGVKVHVLIDWVDSKKLERTFFEQLTSSGVIVERYHPIRWYNLTRINNRTHRKIMVVDGQIGFTGGVGIADQWQGHAQDEDHWRDSHFRVTGPVVAQLQAAFMDNWNTANKEVLHGNDYFPELKPTGKALSQVFKSSPQEGSSSVRLMYLYSIAHAKKTICIANAYFVPDAHMKKLLINASLRGISIEVIVPGKYIDTVVTRRASMSNWRELLEAGIKIHEYQSTMFHCKYMIVDDLWVSVGSTNLDNRSFRLNAECNLNVIDHEHAEKMMKIFEKDKLASREIRLKDWVKRPIVNKALEQLAALTKGQL